VSLFLNSVIFMLLSLLTLVSVTTISLTLFEYAPLSFFVALSKAYVEPKRLAEKTTDFVDVLPALSVSVAVRV